mmetsp:Transcript_12144/g.30320  ORF Transcript_12144/g.30320 Transcript_12144/m.30320 type:complete len:282 (-) Transcript_12144:455-1300(-)
MARSRRETTAEKLMFPCSGPPEKSVVMVVGVVVWVNPEVQRRQQQRDQRCSWTTLRRATTSFPHRASFSRLSTSCCLSPDTFPRRFPCSSFAAASSCPTSSRCRRTLSSSRAARRHVWEASCRLLFSSSYFRHSASLFRTASPTALVASVARFRSSLAWLARACSRAAARWASSEVSCCSRVARPPRPRRPPAVPGTSGPRPAVAWVSCTLSRRCWACCARSSAILSSCSRSITASLAVTACWCTSRHLPSILANTSELTAAASWARLISDCSSSQVAQQS